MSSANHPDTIQASRRFFGYALSHTPESLYEDANQPKPLQLGVRVTNHLVHEALANNLFNHNELRHVGLLLTAAIDDTNTILTQEMRTRDVPLELLPLIARDERTVRSIARLAMHNEAVMRTMTSASANKHYFGLSDDMTHIRLTSNVTDATIGGCPFASSADRMPRPDPLFRRTIHFAGDLTYLAHKK